jgi:hypothetical protein
MPRMSGGGVSSAGVSVQDDNGSWRTQPRMHGARLDGDSWGPQDTPARQRDPEASSRHAHAGREASDNTRGCLTAKGDYEAGNVGVRVGGDKVEVVNKQHEETVRQYEAALEALREEHSKRVAELSTKHDQEMQDTKERNFALMHKVQELESSDLVKAVEKGAKIPVEITQVLVIV